MAAPAVAAAGLFLSALGFISGKKAAKEQLELSKQQFLLQKEQAYEQERKMREQVKQTSDHSNINEAMANARESADAAEQSFNRLAVQRAQALEDQYVGKRTHDVDKLFSGGIPGSSGIRATAVAKAIADRKADMEAKAFGDKGSRVTASFTQAPSGVAGPWAGAYNRAVRTSAGGIEDEMRNRSYHLSQLGRLQEVNKLDQIGMSSLGRSDFEQQRMSDALKSDTTMGRASLDAEKRKIAGEIAQRKAEIERGYNTGQMIFQGPDPSAYNRAASQADLIGGISGIFNSAVNSGIFNRPVTTTAATAATAAPTSVGSGILNLR